MKIEVVVILNISRKKINKLKIKDDVLLAYSENGATEYSLKGITGLDCSNNQLTKLPILPNSIKILLDCSNNQLTSLPFLPRKLQGLNCSDNQLTSLPSLPEKLTRLYCYNNLLTILPPFPKALTTLYCSHNPLLFIFPFLPERFDDYTVPEHFERLYSSKNCHAYYRQHSIYKFLITFVSLDLNISPRITSRDSWMLWTIYPKGQTADRA